MKHWKDTPLQNCGADQVIRDMSYEIDGWFVMELLQMAYLLSSGERIDADLRRDMGQRIQAALHVQIDTP